VSSYRRYNRRVDDSELAEAAAAVWSERLPTSATFARETYWLAVPAVIQRCNRLATGDPSTPWWAGMLAEHLADRVPVRRMLSLGCGAGELERSLGAAGAFVSCEGVDIAPGAIRSAEAAAVAAGIDGISYRVGDLNTVELEERAYDVVWFNMSLHHVRALERLLDEVSRSLRDGGLVILNEYVGANRFGFGERQRAALAAAFDLIPRRLRRYCGVDGPEFLDFVGIPDPAAVALDDPSESIRSSEIVGLVRERFRIATFRDVGGSLLQYALNNIAGNFRDDDPGAMAILRMLFDIEDALIAAGDLPGDFVVVAGALKA
jgi:SAM-dependent methyltransferase